MTTAIDDSYCPLCSKDNRCGANSAKPCWCLDATIDRRLLEQVPKSLAGKACLCQQCIEKFNAEKVADSN